MEDLASAPTSNWGANSYKLSSSYTSIVFEEGVTHIGANTFNGFSYVTSVTIPASVTSSGENAFKGCSKIASIHASNPNNWASIDFSTTSTRYSHPFAQSGGGDFYFYGSDSYTTELYFTPGIECIKKCAFYNAKTISRVCIPASVSEIQNYALDCNMTYFVTLRTDAITLGTSSPLTFKTGSDSYLYLPNGANSDYKSNSKFYDGNKATEEGASKIGYSSSDAGATTWGTGNYVYPLSGTTGDLKWEIIQNTGTLRIYGNGSASSSYTDGSSSLPWYRFKLLIDKVVIEGVKGNVAHIYNNIKFLPALREIQIIQSTMPNINSDGIASTLRHNENIAVKIKPAALADASASKLGSAPWDSNKLCIHVTIDQDSTNNTAILTNCSTYVKNPINLKLNRTTMSKDYFNTFCSPVAISDISGTFGAGTYLYEFTNTSIEKDTLRLNFVEATEIEAGKPYLIQPANSITSLSFLDVDPSDIVTEGGSVDGTNATFYGTLAPTSTDGYTENKKFIFLLAYNKLTYATEGTLKGLRAYFLLDDDVEPGVLAHSPKMRFHGQSEGGETPTAIDKTKTEVKAEKVMENGVMYIIKNGVKYSVMGQIIK